MKIPAVLLAALLVLASAALPAAADIWKPSGTVVLTIAGNIGNSNRPAYDDWHDVLLKYHEYAFDKAFEFDHAMLERQDVAEVRIERRGWPGPVTFSGPRLADVLKTVGWRGGELVALSLDGYSQRISRVEVEARDWVLATRADGRPLAIGGRGPLWLLFDPPGDWPASEDEEAAWPWALFFILCE